MRFLLGLALASAIALAAPVDHQVHAPPDARAAVLVDAPSVPLAAPVTFTAADQAPLFAVPELPSILPASLASTGLAATTVTVPPASERWLPRTFPLRE